jgi:hypothetical protein
MATMKSPLVSNYENEHFLILNVFIDKKRRKSQLSSLRKTQVYFVTLNSERSIQKKNWSAAISFEKCFSSGLRGHTILKLAYHALFKMARIGTVLCCIISWGIDPMHYTTYALGVPRTYQCSDDKRNCRHIKPGRRAKVQIWTTLYPLGRFCFEITRQVMRCQLSCKGDSWTPY